MIQQNDGSARDRFFVDSSGGGSSGFTVKFLRGTTNITTAVTNGTFLTGKLAVGKSATIKCVVTVGSGTHGADISRLLLISQTTAPATMRMVCTSPIANTSRSSSTV